MKRLVVFLVAVVSAVFCVQAQTREDFQRYLKGAGKGDMIYQYNTGVCYATGHGVAKDSIQAFDWYAKSAAQGYKYAQFHLGLCYYDGVGVTADYDKAVEWFRLSADQGYAPAQIMMGVCYYLGNGTVEDEYQAAGWFRKAAEQGDSYAQYMLGLCYYWGEGAVEDENMGVMWFKKSAEQNDINGQFMLGVCYYWGTEIDEDSELAKQLFSKAAERGHHKAQSYLDDFDDIWQDYYFYDSGDYEFSDLIYYLRWSFLEDDIVDAILGYDVPAVIYDRSTSKKTESGIRKEERSLNRKHAWWNFQDFMSEFNCPKGYAKPFGVSAGYVSKQWDYIYTDGSKEKGSMFDDKPLHGVQAGVRWNPLLKFGFGFDMGLYYEYYYDKSDMQSDSDDWGAYNYYVTFNEHNLHLPVHLEYRFNFTENFQMFVYGGASLDYALYCKFSSYEEGYDDEPYGVLDEDVYGGEILPDNKRFNASLSFGGGVRVYSWQLNVGTRRGLINMSSSPDYVVKQNNPISVSLSFMF